MLKLDEYTPVISPVSGEWVAVNTPAERVPSHGTDYLGQTYAFDLVRLNASGTGFSTKSVLRQFFFFIPAEDFLAWGAPVHAAFSGEVIATGDHWPDQKRVNSLWQLIRATFLVKQPTSDYRPLLGNYCLVRGDLGVALYAHLQLQSLKVCKGDTVEAGQVLGRVGNSGNSTMPHLHFHVMSCEDFTTAKGVPVSFRNYYVNKAGERKLVAVGVPEMMQRFVAAPVAAPNNSFKPTALRGAA